MTEPVYVDFKPRWWQDPWLSENEHLMQIGPSSCTHPQAEYTPGEDWQCPECHWQGPFFPAELTD